MRLLGMWFLWFLTIIHYSCHDIPSTLQVFDLGYQSIVRWCDRPWRPMAPPDVRTNMACTGRLHQLQRVLVGHRVDVDVAGGVTRQPRLPLTLWGIKKKCTFHRMRSFRRHQQPQAHHQQHTCKDNTLKPKPFKNNTNNNWQQYNCHRQQQEALQEKQKTTNDHIGRSNNNMNLNYDNHNNDNTNLNHSQPERWTY